MKWEDRYKILCREAERDAYCRGCDAVINKGEKMISTYSFRNRGQHIHFCPKCANLIGELAQNLC